MTQTSIHELTGAYALDAVTDEERAAFERHLRECDACTAETAQFRAVAAELALLEQRTAPASLRDTVLRQVAQTAQLPAERVDELAARRASRSRKIMSTVGGALVAAAAVTGVIVLTQDGGPDAADIRAAADAQTFKAEVANGAEAVFVLSESEDAGLLTLAGLPEPEQGSRYQLWLVDDEGPRPVEDQFEPDADGTATVVVDDVPAGVEVAMTLETDPEPTVPDDEILVAIPTSDA